MHENLGVVPLIECQRRQCNQELITFVKESSLGRRDGELEQMVADLEQHSSRQRRVPLKQTARSRVDLDSGRRQCVAHAEPTAIEAAESPVIDTSVIGKRSAWAVKIKCRSLPLMHTSR